ncbi:MAG: dockerin type I repeat-containing protein [Oscillospiraceae bacterium]
MKKIICLLLCLSVLSSIAMIDVSAIETDAPTAITETEDKITDLETIYSILDNYLTEQNYYTLMGTVVFQKSTKEDPITKLVVHFDYVPLDNLELDKEATEKIREYLDANNIDLSLVTFQYGEKPPLAVEGKINDPEVISAMIKDFVKERYPDVMVGVDDREYGNETISMVNVTFPDDRYKSEDYESLYNFMEQNNINTEFVEILMLCVHFIKGDVNNDNNIDITDVVLARSYIVGNGSLTAEQIKIADINGDDAVDILDIVALRSEIVNLII